MTPADRAIRLNQLLGLRSHRDGCPFEDPGVEGARMEGYDVIRPERPGQPAGVVGVVRCIECGGHRVLDRPVERVLDNLAKS